MRPLNQTFYPDSYGSQCRHLRNNIIIKTSSIRTTHVNINGIAKCQGTAFQLINQLQLLYAAKFTVEFIYKGSIYRIMLAGKAARSLK